MTMWFFVALLAWVLLVAGFLLRHAATLRALWREPVLRLPVVIVESDDWGVGPQGDADMLDRIAQRLVGIRDATGHPAVMTLGLVSGHPDGARILASGLAQYHRRTLDEPAFSTIVEAIRAGCAAGVFAVQRHGLEHCWPASLLAQAREDDSLRRWLADPAARSEALPSPLQSRWVDAASLPSRPLGAADVMAAVQDEAVLLQRLFGKAPAVAVPNTFVWDDTVERAWQETGVTCIVTPGRRLEGRTASGGLGPATYAIRNGDRTHGGVMLVVRDEYFEPFRGHRAERVWAAVGRKRELGRPVLLETHRESFSAEGGAASLALDELERALRGVLDRQPDVRFMSTEVLAQHLADPASPLVLRSPRARAEVFLRRVLCEPSMGRALKVSGLRFLLPLLAGAAARVVGRGPATMAR